MRIGALTLLALGVVLVGCGSPPDSRDLNTDWARPYLDPRSDLVVAVNFDAGSDEFAQIRDFYPRLKPLIANENGIAPIDFDDAARFAARRAGLDYGSELKPALTGPLVIGVQSDSGEQSLVYRTDDPETVARFLRELGFDVSAHDDIVSTREAGAAVPEEAMPARSDALVRLRAEGRAVESLFPRAAGLVSAEGGPSMRTLDATLELGDGAVEINGRADYSSDLDGVPDSPDEFDLRGLLRTSDVADASTLFPRAKFVFSIDDGDLVISGEIPFGEVPRTGSIIDIFY